ncbi:hypothetical protein B0O99DRAFT_519420, partial [Bisporella sp. PMI_857]
QVTDGPNGTLRANFYDGTTAPCFLNYISMATIFNSYLTRRTGRALSQEVKTKVADVLGLTVCSHKSPLGVSNFEASSEDPIHSGLLYTEYYLDL